MSILIPILVLILVVVVSKYFLKSYFNHLVIYTISWSLFIVLYELKLIRFIEIKGETWFIIIVSYTAFLLGAITYLSVDGLKNRENNTFIEPLSISGIENRFNIKRIRNIILTFSIIGLLAVLFEWSVLINKFGSIAKVLINANFIYRQRVAGESINPLPYLFITSYIGIFFAGIYTAYKRSFNLVSLVPIVGIILKGMASVGRGGIFVGFLIYIINYFLFSLVISRQAKFAKEVRVRLVVSILFFVIVGVGSMAVIKEIRGTNEDLKGTTTALKEFTNSSIISPSVYFYFSSNIGVLSKYFESGGEDEKFATNTMLPVYNVLAKFGIVKQPEVYPDGFYIPIWSNSATYLRDLHADFGFPGLIIVPYLLGFLTTIFWFKFIREKRLLDFVFLSYLMLIISFSVFYMVTRAAFIPVSFFTILLLSSSLEGNYFNKKTKKPINV